MEAISRQEGKEIQLRLLREFASICDKHGLNYYLAYGTMLGAVRHKGFIPWDDDIDVYMDRPEYEKLICLLRDPAVPKPEWMEVLDLHTNGYFYPFAKVTDNRTIARMENNKTEHGIWIDVFPIDTLPADAKKSNRFEQACFFLRDVVISMTTDFASKNLYSWKNTLKRRVLCAGAQLIGKKRIARFYDRFCQRYNKEMSDYAGCLFSAYGSRDRFIRPVLFEKADYPFEDGRFCGPSRYDEYLTTLYKDYMTPPPEDKRASHYINACWK